MVHKGFNQAWFSKKGHPIRRSQSCLCSDGLEIGEHGKELNLQCRKIASTCGLGDQNTVNRCFQLNEKRDTYLRDVLSEYIVWFQYLLNLLFGLITAEFPWFQASLGIRTVQLAVCAFERKRFPEISKFPKFSFPNSKQRTVKSAASRTNKDLDFESTHSHISTSFCTFGMLYLFGRFGKQTLRVQVHQPSGVLHVWLVF